MSNRLKIRKLKAATASALILAGMLWYVFCLPDPLFKDPYSTVLKARGNELLSASIARDGQWRFPQTDSISEKFIEALILYEDKRFRSHPGVDPLSMARALRQNFAQRRVVSGGSTISMQVIRLSRKGKSRSIIQKGLEVLLATRLEIRYSKKDILNLYASHAPFGGNVVGLEAACWRYFGRSPHDLSWGEAALLAVLPNAPSLIHPGKNRELLKLKRDRLLDKLEVAGKIDQFTCSLSKEEPIPQEPQSLPRHARHLLNRAMNEGSAERIVKSTLDHALQLRVEEIVMDHHQKFKSNQIHNGAAIVLEVSTGKVLAYVGNTPATEKGNHGGDVDIITSARSTGSILKPFLFAGMLDEGKILSASLIPDVPTIISGFSPKNFSNDYDGGVAANKALTRSLNIPAVHMLRTYRYEKFYSLLNNMGMGTLDQPAEHYGLSLVLGGAEGALGEIAGMYASMARTLNNYSQHPGRNRYAKTDFHPPYYKQPFLDPSERAPEVEQDLEEGSWLSAAAIYQTFEALTEVYRPGEDSGWKYFTSSKKIAWKTGTSFGFRDAWAVGVTPDYVVGVWIGNADGEGRPGLTGTDAAAPVMFDIFSLLKKSSWFQAPLQEMEKITVCKESGFRNSSTCSDVDTVLIARVGLRTTSCPFHKMLHLTSNHKFRIHSACESMEKIVQANWFVLPPLQEYYFRSKNLSYKVVPPFRKDCEMLSSLTPMDLIYPKPDSKIFIPRELSGVAGKVVFELAHRNPDTIVYWHLDGNYLGSTKGRHHFPLNPAAGRHFLTVVDDTGESLNSSFDVFSNL